MLSTEDTRGDLKGPPRRGLTIREEMVVFSLLSEHRRSLESWTSPPNKRSLSRADVTSDKIFPRTQVALEILRKPEGSTPSLKSSYFAHPDKAQL